MVLVYVPAGEFLMGGADPEGLSRSHAVGIQPTETVTLEAFWLDRTEVTNQQYAACVQAGLCAAPVKPLYTMRPQYFENPEYANYPVVGVTWEDAVAYCDWVGRRLPTEAEWEKAARGEDGRMYPWGDEPPTCDLVNYAPCRQDTMPADSLPEGESPYGALHMAGNVWEWVVDWYGSEAYPTLAPKGDDPVVSLHVVRGGSWVDGESALHTYFRFFGYPIDAASVGFGFRCARDISQ
jgi:serine/threonine-protein kinase